MNNTKTYNTRHYLLASVLTFIVFCVMVGGFSYLQHKRLEAHILANTDKIAELKIYKESLYLTAQAYALRVAELKRENKELKEELKKLKGGKK